jgi:signal transduction histidine kinase
VQLLDMGLHGPVTEEQHAALARVDRAQRHLLGLVNDVLNYARLGSGRVEYDVEPVLVADVLADVLPMVEPQIAAQGLAVEVHLPERGPTGPTGRPPVRVWADREKLGQVFLNLLSNAIKFTPAGGKITVELTERGDGSGPADVAFLRVADTGIGIPADKLDAVFEPFVQVRTDYARTSGGTGLGLAISRDLARGMGGELRVRSREGAGSAFTITLRRVPPGGAPASE